MAKAMVMAKWRIEKLALHSIDHNNSDQCSIEAWQNCNCLFIQTDQFGGQNMWGNSPDDTSQNTIQLVILAVSLVCIPLMLIPKPWIEISRMKKKKTFDS